MGPLLGSLGSNLLGGTLGAVSGGFGGLSQAAGLSSSLAMDMNTAMNTVATAQHSMQTQDNRTQTNMHFENINYNQEVQSAAHRAAGSFRIE